MTTKRFDLDDESFETLQRILNSIVIMCEELFTKPNDFVGDAIDPAELHDEAKLFLEEWFED